MIFASQVFLFWFLPFALATYYLTPRPWKALQLTLVSYVFYGWWRVDFVALMLASTALDFYCGGAIGRLGERLGHEVDDTVRRRLVRRRKAILWASIVTNLGALAYFKYANFGIESMNALLAELGVAAVEWPKVILPVGISFYTFQTMSYSIDVYRGEARRVDRFVDFACYVAMFPQLVAGPIVRYQTVAEELRSRTHTWRKFADGAFLLQLGFVKKVLLADTIAKIADDAFALPDPGFVDAWLGTAAYAFQIYFDFSGYSDMAIGLGLMFGFTFPINFDSPYKSESITEFWRRWHVSLSTWLRDYLYLPLGGNRRGAARTYVNLMATMVLGGLWHGAAWTFVAWGAYQGLWLVLERALGKRPFYAAAPRAIRVGCTFVIALGGWVFFRAVDMDQALGFLSAMSGFGPGDLALGSEVAVTQRQAFALVCCAVVAWLFPNSSQLVARHSWVSAAFVSLLFPVAIAQLFFASHTPFLYFQF